MSEKIEVKNVNVPGQVSRVDVATFQTMMGATMTVIDQSSPMTSKATKEAAKPHLTKDLSPGRATSGSWQKTVELELEARGIILRHLTKPLIFSIA